MYVCMLRNAPIWVHRKFVSNSCYSKIAYKTNLTQPNQT